MKKIYPCLALAAGLLCANNNVFANPATQFTTGWTDFTTSPSNGYAEDYVGAGGQVYPGWGGQAFDAEYFFYKIDGNILSIALQTGFNLKEGQQNFSGGSGSAYTAGDLFLSFDGSDSAYEYAVDFGKKGSASGDEKLKTSFTTQYITDWNVSVPLQANGGTTVAGALTAKSNGFDKTVNSYWTIVSLDLTKIFSDNWEKNGFILDALWTMSCGNDVIKGEFTKPGAPVPEPATMLLFGTGIAGLAGVVRRRQMSN